MAYELRVMVNRCWWRWLTCWFGGAACLIVSYRLDRCGYLLAGSAWAVLRLLLLPLFLTLRLLSAKHEIHYHAEIGKGLRVLHPSLGVVVSAHTIAGEQLILTGGNCIGGRRPLRRGDLVLGNNVTLGANAVVLGPVRIGSRVVVGAGAVVIESCGDNTVLVGVPARPAHLSDAATVADQLIGGAQ
jgi:serine O-acetyltransferase